MSALHALRMLIYENLWALNEHERLLFPFSPKNSIIDTLCCGEFGPETTRVRDDEGGETFEGKIRSARFSVLLYRVLAHLVDKILFCPAKLNQLLKKDINFFVEKLLTQVKLIS